MRNKYEGRCYRCNEKVKPKEGHFELIPFKERVSTAKWRMQHANCAIIFRGSNIGKEPK